MFIPQLSSTLKEFPFNQLRQKNCVSFSSPFPLSFGEIVLPTTKPIKWSIQHRVRECRVRRSWHQADRNTGAVQESIFKWFLLLFILESTIYTEWRGPLCREPIREVKPFGWALGGRTAPIRWRPHSTIGWRCTGRVALRGREEQSGSPARFAGTGISPHRTLRPRTKSARWVRPKALHWQVGYSLFYTRFLTHLGNVRSHEYVPHVNRLDSILLLSTSDTVK